MNQSISNEADSVSAGMAIPQIAGRASLATSTVVLFSLAALHILSPEFDPSWRMVSEYALGNYGWVLSLMFVAWALSSWALAFSISSQVRTLAGKIGLGFLVVAGIGEAMASVFDINHSLHGLSALIGIGSLPIAAMLISASLGSNDEWVAVKKVLLWTANLTWVSVLVMGATFGLLIFTYIQTGGDMTAGAVTVLPAGVIALVGWANRLLIVIYCVWVMTVAGYAVNASSRSS